MTTAVVTKVYESLMYCEKCGGNKWYFVGDIPYCITCQPVQGPFDEISLPVRHWPWNKENEIKSRAKAKVLILYIKATLPEELPLIAVFACNSYEEKTARSLKREIRRNISENPKSALEKWTLFIENTVRVKL
jgi:hypothetical protein